MSDAGASFATLATEASGFSVESDDDEADTRVPAKTSRHNSDVSLASRALSLEEGHIHRLGQHLRRDIVNSVSTEASPTQAAPSSDASRHLADAVKAIDNLSGAELRDMAAKDGWKGALDQLGVNIEELRQMQASDPVGWEKFRESQLKARLNAERDGGGSAIE